MNSLVAISIQNVKKYYQNLAALKGINLQIPKGEFFGLLGPNGAGKTTLINCVVGLAKPSAGEIFVFGNSIKTRPLAAKSTIGFSPQEINTDRFFNLRRTLEFQGGFHGLSLKESQKRASELLEKFGLQDKAKEQFYKLSGGMQKRLLIARALISQPQLLILDEPTAGVDVAQRHELWKSLRQLHQSGTTIILTTHYIDEAEELCERIGIINHGQIIETGSPKDLIEKYCQTEIQIKTNQDLDEEELNEIPHHTLEKNLLKIQTTAIGLTIEKVIPQILTKQGRRILDINVSKGNLEEVFIHLTGKSLVEEEGI